MKSLAQIAYDVYHEVYGTKIQWPFIEQAERDAWEDAIDAVLDEIKKRTEDQIDES